MNNVLIVANFSAGRKQAIKYKKKIQKFLLRKRASFHFITIDQLSEADMDLFDTILVVGGDGTVNKVLPYLVNTTKTLGIIPCGTANLLASKLGINSISKALKVIDKELGELGTINEVMETVSNYIYVVEYKGKPLCIPIIDGVVEKVDLDNGTINVVLPKGLI